MKSDVIEVHLREIKQLFDGMDPSPFRERDLDPKAEEYIVESVKELSSPTVGDLVIYLDHPMSMPNEEKEVAEAIRVHFARRAEFLRKDLRQLIRRGFVSLAIGIAFLSTLFIIARLVARHAGSSVWVALFREGLLIAGWVAMWRPIEIFLYDWWPILGEQRIRERLSKVKVQIVVNSAEAGL